MSLPATSVVKNVYLEIYGSAITVTKSQKMQSWIYSDMSDLDLPFSVTSLPGSRAKSPNYVAFSDSSAWVNKQKICQSFVN